MRTNSGGSSEKQQIDMISELRAKMPDLMILSAIRSWQVRAGTRRYTLEAVRYAHERRRETGEIYFGKNRLLKAMPQDQW